jgi:hypothetical protein
MSGAAAAVATTPAPSLCGRLNSRENQPAAGACSNIIGLLNQTMRSSQPINAERTGLFRLECNEREYPID